MALLERTGDRSRFLRFTVVGIANTVVHYLVYLALWWVLPYLAAHLVAVTVSMSCSYLLNCRFTFRTRPTWRKFVLYPLSNLTNITMSTGTLCVLVELFRVDSRIATIVGGLLAVPATFLVSKIILVGR